MFLVQMRSAQESIMSNVSNRHNVNPFVAGKSQALINQRLAKVGYKSSKKTPAQFPSVCVSVPKIEPGQFQGETLISALPHIVEFFSGVQDKVIRSLYESASGNLTSVSDDEIGLQSCINFLEAESIGNRFSAEFIEKWFDSQVKENLTVVIADKLGFDELNDDQMVTIGKHLAGYRALFAGLAGKNVFYQPTQVSGLIRALEVSSADDEVSEKLLKKLNEMKPVEELLGL
jgi:hypothetical protein